MIATGKLKCCMRKVAYIERFGLRHTDFDSALLSQLSFCKSDEARRHSQR